jgi:hypothetical protein
MKQNINHYRVTYSQLGETGASWRTGISWLIRLLNFFKLSSVVLRIANVCQLTKRWYVQNFIGLLVIGLRL